MCAVIAADLGKPESDVDVHVALTCELGLVWYPAYRASLCKLVRLLDRLPARCAKRLVKGIASLAAHNLCNCHVAADVAEVLANGICSHGDEDDGAVATVNALGTMLRDQGCERIPQSVPLLLQCVAAGLSPSEAESIFHLHAEGALKAWQDMSETVSSLPDLPPSRRTILLRCMRATALHTISDGRTMSLLPCEERELQFMMTLMQDASLKDSFFIELLELADFGIYRSQWTITLQVLVGLPSCRRHDALRCAAWLHASAPRWLSWHFLLQDVQAIDCRDDRMMVVEIIGDILACDHDVEGRRGKDEDIAAGLEASLAAWLSWLPVAAAQPGWADKVCNFFRIILPLDPGGRSPLVRRLARAHKCGATHCRWTSVELRRRGSPCYCYHIVAVLVPRLVAISSPADKALLDAFEVFVRWRKGLSLIAAAERAEALAGAQPSRTLPGIHLARMLQCYQLLSQPESAQIFTSVNADVALTACKQWCNVDARMRKMAMHLPAEAAPLYVHLLIGTWYANPAERRCWILRKPWTQGLACALTRAPPSLMTIGSWLQSVLLACCMGWRLTGLAEKDMMRMSLQACRSFSAVITTRREAPCELRTYSIFAF